MSNDEYAEEMPEDEEKEEALRKVNESYHSGRNEGDKEVNGEKEGEEKDEQLDVQEEADQGSILHPQANEEEEGGDKEDKGKDDEKEEKKRNEVIDDYINNMGNNDFKKTEEMEDDEFDKAEAKYKQKPSIAEENPTQHNGDEDNKESPIEEEQPHRIKDRYEEQEPEPEGDPYGQGKVKANDPYATHEYVKSQHSLQKKITLQKSPGYLYEQENKSIKRQQTQRKKQASSLQNSYSHTEADQPKPIEASNNPTEHHPQLKPVHSQRFRKKAKDPRRLKEENVIYSLSNPSNPFSNRWHNYILNVRYGSYLQVKSFLNGVPQFKISKLKLKHESPKGQFNTQMAHLKGKGKKSQSKNQIHFPLIYKYFNSNHANAN